ncbi:MAG: Maf family protein [Candidatus Omnitrophota bacterium]
MPFILASSSPRRKELLGLIGITPQIIIPEADETKLPDETIEGFLQRVSIAKGEAVYKPEFYDIPVISSDTIVVCENRVIGKPSGRDEAYEFLKLLSNKKHEVLTGVCIRYRGQTTYEYERTEVVFSEISEEELGYYLDHEDYMDKAGAYAIQGKASVFIKRIDGCFFNVMGFPLNRFYNMLKKIGISLFPPLY